MSCLSTDLPGRSTGRALKPLTSQSDRVKWISEARWVKDGPFATSSGVSAGTDMALAIIARLFGRERAQSIADRTEYVKRGDVGAGIASFR